MPFFILALIIACLVLCGLILLANGSDMRDMEMINASKAILAISLPLIVWMVLSIFTISTSEIKEYKIHTIDNVQYIKVNDKLINVNSKAGRVFDDNKQLKRTTYGYKLGIDYEFSPEYTQ